MSAVGETCQEAPAPQAAQSVDELSTLSGRRLLMVAHSNSAHTGRWARYFQQQNMDVLVVSPVEDTIAGIRTVRFPDGPRWYHRLKGAHLYIDYGRWKRIFREFQPDITHVHYPDGGGRNRFYFDHVPRLITSTWGSEVTESAQYPLTEKHKAGVRAILAKSQVVTATTTYLAQVTARYCKPGTPIHIIPFGVDCEQFSPAVSPRYTKADGEIRIGFFKNLERKYGPEVLLEAFAMIRKAYPRTRLILCGKGPMLEPLRQRAAILGVSDHVEFPGRLPHAQVVAAMREVDILVMPSTCEESFGVAAIEASAMEIPVVATRVGGVPEAVEDGRTGTLVPPFDASAVASACIDLIANPDRRVSLGRLGRKFVLDNYQWWANAATMGKVYAQMIAGDRVISPKMITAEAVA